MPFEAYFEIAPDFSDPDTYVTYTVANPACRASLKIYADLTELSEVALALKNPNLQVEWPSDAKDFTLSDECCMNIAFSVIPREGDRKTFRALIVNDADTEHPYRAVIDIHLPKTEADDFGDSLLRWIEHPDCHFIWKL